jgi:hypothetical protein
MDGELQGKKEGARVTQMVTPEKCSKWKWTQKRVKGEKRGRTAARKLL